MKRFATVLVLGLLAAPCAALAVQTADCGWETSPYPAILGSYNDITASISSAEFYEGSKSLELVDGDAGSTPQAYVAWITGLQNGDVVTASFYAKTRSGNGVRIWGHYTDDPGDIDSYAGSAGGSNTYSGETWTYLEYTWTFVSSEGSPNGLVVEARTYSAEGDGGWVDALHIEAPDAAVIYTPCEAGDPPPSVVGKMTTLAKNGGATTIDLCINGGVGSVTTNVVSLPVYGDLSDNGGVISSTPHAVSGTLKYTPDSGFAGLDSFDFTATDSQPATSAVATQELGVQAGGVVITEVMHDPSSYQSTYEFVEIYNYSGSAISLGRIDSWTTDTVDTTNNLALSTIPAGEARIIAIDNTVEFPDSADEFRCEWRLDESEIIRVNVDNWEFISANPSTTSCSASSGSRVLVFDAAGELLDAVDLGLVGAYDCEDSSYVISPYFSFDFPDAIMNDDGYIWYCAGPESDDYGLRTGDITGDYANPKYIPEYITSPTYEQPCFGACCLTDGDCVDGITESECTAMRCDMTGGFTQGGTCTTSMQNTCEAGADDFIKCCLPTGTCLDTSECACLQIGGDPDDSTTCEINNECAVTTLVINELDYDNVGDEVNEFIEIYGDPNKPLTGWSLEFFNGADSGGDNIYRTIDLSMVPGGVIPADGYLVIGGEAATGELADAIDYAAWESTGAIQNGSSDGNSLGDGVVLLYNGATVEVVDAFSYENGGSNGFYAIGGSADGTFLPTIEDGEGAEVADSALTTLQKIPDAGVWTETNNSTPGATNFDAGEVGACCDTYAQTCTITLPADCVDEGLEYQGDGTDCDPNPCVPSGACCVPNGSCFDGVTEDRCVDIVEGSWLGEGSVCPDIEEFVSCLEGPVAAAGAGCEAWDYDTDDDVDLMDFAQFTLDICQSDPIGACCQPGGDCVEVTEWECENLYGPDAYRGDGVVCEGLDPACPAVMPGDILINEIWSDDPSTDDNEFIELFGDPGASLSGYSLIIVEGETGGAETGAAYRKVNLAMDLTGYSLDVNGYFVAGTGPALNPYIDVNLDQVFGNADTFANEIQNGSQTYALVLTSDIEYCSSNGIPDAYCTDNGDQLTEASVAAITANAIDTVATRYDPNETTFDHTYFFAPVVQDSGKYAFDYAQRIPNGTDTNMPEDWETIYGNEMGDPGDPSSPGAVNAALDSIPGACCIDEGAECQVLLYDECIGTNGTWQGHGSACSPNPCMCGSIAQAKTYPAGTAVCIVDAVVSSTEDFVYSSNSKDTYIQDIVGTNGVQIYGVNADVDAMQLTDGDIIDIRGTLDLYYETYELLAPFTVEKHGSMDVIPFETTPDIYQETNPRGDALTSTLVVLRGVTFQETGEFTGGKAYHVSADGGTTSVILYTSTQSLTGLDIPAGPQDIVGIFKAYSSYYEILPRTIDDFTPSQTK